MWITEEDEVASAKAQYYSRCSYRSINCDSKLGTAALWESFLNNM